MALVFAAALVFTAAAQEESDAPDPERVAQGEVIFQETAGGVGCAYCHGEDGRGAGTAGTNAPNIQGAQESALRSSLGGAVPLMSFIDLSEDELQAVLAYLEHLARQPADGAEGDGGDADGADEDDAQPDADAASEDANGADAD